MRPAARVSAAIEVIDRWCAGKEGLDRILLAWGMQNRYAGSADRRAIGDLVHDAIRRLRSACWIAGTDGAIGTAQGRGAMIGSLALDGADLDALFSGETYAPAPLAGDERPRDPARLADAPLAVRCDMPDWLMPNLNGLAPEALEELRYRAPLDLRVNLLKSDPAKARAALAEDGIDTEPGPLSPQCLRVTSGARRVSASRAYREGHVEIQDAASQATALTAAPSPGGIVVDYCAGGGGKALAFAALMGGVGRIVAHDADPARLAALVPRAERAGAKIERMTTPDLHATLRGRADLVVVDAPCSGSGAWRRNPDAKWRFTAERLDELRQLQGQILAAAAELVRPGGRLCYITCSILDAENGAQVDRALAALPGIVWDSPPLSLAPARAAGDGFFAQSLKKVR